MESMTRAQSMEPVRWARERQRPRHRRAEQSSTRAPRPTRYSSASSLLPAQHALFFYFSYSLCLQTPQQAKERVLPLKCGSFCEKCYDFLVMYCNYEYKGKIKKLEPDVRFRRRARSRARYLTSVELRSRMRHV